MKHLIYIVIFVICSLSNYISAKTLDTTDIKPKIQYGYVKTKGKINSNGTISPGKRLAGVTITLKGGISVISDASGNFQFKVFGNNFHIQNISKKGYLLVDPEVLSKTYAYSTNPLVISMETPDEQLEQRLANERKIRRTLQRTLQQREDEIEALKEQNKISEEEYRKALQKIYDEQRKNEKLISEMAERYSKTDYDQISEFDKEFNQYILNGEITKADSLLYSKGQLHEDIKEKEKNLEIKDELLKLKKEDLAHNCYKIFERYKLEYQNDSAAYYLELRASLDTTNIEWQLDAGNFICQYLADFTNSKIYYNRVLHLEKNEYINPEFIYSIHNDIGLFFFKQSHYSYAIDHFLIALKACSNKEELAQCYNNIGMVLESQGKFAEALNYYQKALEIDLQAYGETHPDVAISYNNIGELFVKQGKYNKALDYLQKALEIRLQVYGETHPNVAISYNNIGYVLDSQGNYNEALKYYQKALEIDLQAYGETHPDVTISYNNIGAIYSSQGNYNEALIYHQKALEIDLQAYGETHPYVAISYNNIGELFVKQGKYNEALDYLQKALEIRLQVYGETHPDVAISYNNIGELFVKQGKYNEALDYLQKALEIRLQVYGETHPDVATSYYNIGMTFANQGKYNEALDYLQKALVIISLTSGENHSNVATIYKKIGNIHESLGNTTKAIIYYDKGIKIEIKNAGIKDMMPYYSAGNNYKLHFEQKATDLYTRFEYHKKDLRIDSATYYIELRAALDTNNIQWQLDAGNFILNNLNKTNEDIALNYFKRALIISLNKEKSEKDGNNNIVTSYLGLGNLYYQLGNFGHALNEYKKGEELFSQSNQISTLEYSKLAEQIAFTYNSMKSYDEALTYHQKALEIKLSLLNESDSDIGKCYNNIGAIYENIGNYNLSEEYYLKATDIFKTIYSNDSINENIAICYNNLGGIYDRLEQFDNAIEYYNKSIEIYNHLPFNSVGLGCTYNNLASTFYSLNNYPQAIVYYGKALNELKKIKNDNDPTIKTIKQNIDIVIKEMAK